MHSPRADYGVSSASAFRPLRRLRRHAASDGFRQRLSHPPQPWTTLWTTLPSCDATSALARPRQDCQNFEQKNLFDINGLLRCRVLARRYIGRYLPSIGAAVELSGRAGRWLCRWLRASRMCRAAHGLERRPPDRGRLGAGADRLRRLHGARRNLRFLAGRAAATATSTSRTRTAARRCAARCSGAPRSWSTSTPTRGRRRRVARPALRSTSRAASCSSSSSRCSAAAPARSTSASCACRPSSRPKVSSMRR